MGSEMVLWSYNFAFLEIRGANEKIGDSEKSPGKEFVLRSISLSISSFFLLGESQAQPLQLVFLGNSDTCWMKMLGICRNGHCQKVDSLLHVISASHHLRNRYDSACFADGLRIWLQITEIEFKHIWAKGDVCCFIQLRNSSLLGVCQLCLFSN